MVTVKWTDQAIQDIDNISEFIAKDSEKYAQIQAKRFFETATILTSHPKLGKPVPEIGEETVRQLLLGNYRIIYRIISPSLIHILTIHHSRRLLANNPQFKSE